MGVRILHIHSFFLKCFYSCKLIVEYVSGHDVLPFFPSAMEKACATGGLPGVFHHLLQHEEPSIVQFNDVIATHANRKLLSGRTTLV